MWLINLIKRDQNKYKKGIKIQCMGYEHVGTTLLRAQCPLPGPPPPENNTINDCLHKKEHKKRKERNKKKRRETEHRQSSETRVSLSKYEFATSASECATERK